MINSHLHCSTKAESTKDLQISLEKKTFSAKTKLKSTTTLPTLSLLGTAHQQKLKTAKKNPDDKKLLTYQLGGQEWRIRVTLKRVKFRVVVMVMDLLKKKNEVVVRQWTVVIAQCCPFEVNHIFFGGDNKVMMVMTQLREPTFVDQAMSHLQCQRFGSTFPPPPLLPSFVVV